MRVLPRRSHRTRGALVALAMGVPLVMSMPGAAVAHDKFGLDHPADGFRNPDARASTTVNSDTAGDGENLGWELITSVPTGNPHTDLDFFTKDGESFASVGTLGTGPNGGGQSIIQLTRTNDEGVQTVDPAFFSAHPSAFCPSNPRSVLGLQHDVEATPKSSDVVNNSAQFPTDAAADVQLLLDATDASGRCHDQGTLGVTNAPSGGLEIVDVTDLKNPVEIGLTSHIGQAHTVNVDPRRPHIAYAVTSDSISVSKDAKDANGNGDKEELIRENEIPGDNDQFDLDGFEVVDLSSCMNFPAGTSVEQKREQCRPQVFRHRYESLDVSLGHTNLEQVFGCHELEIYPNDRLTCGSGGAAIVFNMAGAFDDNGTPADFTDDKPTGTPLPCRVRPSSTSATAYDTGAMVTDCVAGGTTEAPIDLSVPNWLKIGSPSLAGVEHIGSIYHQGRDGDGLGEPFPATEDIDFNHETEFTRSGDFLIATDERGGGVLAGAQCASGNDVEEINGGVNAYQVDELRTADNRPTTPEEAFEAYARGTDGEKAIFRAPVRTGAEATFCTAHVMQQAPDQNRIFMGWYTQGTQVVDYVELPDGRLEWVEDADAQAASEGTDSEPEVTAQAETEQAGYFIPENANTWVSHVFRTEDNGDGTFTYFGATGDFLLGNDGRNTIDVYKVTLPAPATACTLAPESEVSDREAAREVHRPNIDCALHYEIASGTGDGSTYGPAGEVTRGQMASFIVNAINAATSGEDMPAASGGDRFSDLGVAPTHRENINRLAAEGIIKGTGDGKFDPNRTITRAEMATFVTNAAEFITGEEITAERADHFGDIQRSVHQANINAGFEREYFSGTTAPTAGEANSGVFSPNLVVQRDQMASFLTNLFTRTITQRTIAQ